MRNWLLLFCLSCVWCGVVEAAPARKRSVYGWMLVLRSGQAAQQVEATRQLSLMGKRAKPAKMMLVKMLLSGPKQARPYAAKALIQLEEQAIPALLATFQAKEAAARARGIRVLGVIGKKVSKTSVKALMMAMKRPNRLSDYLSRTLAALGPKVLVSLERYLKAKWAHRVIKEHAVLAVCRMASSLSVGGSPQTRRPARRMIAKWLSAGSSSMRQLVAEQFRVVGDGLASMLPKLLSLRTEQEVTTRWVVFWALTGFSGRVLSAHQKVLWEATGDSFRKVCENAKKALAKIGAGLYPEAKRRLQGSSATARLVALEVLLLAPIHAKKMLPQLESILVSSGVSEQERCAAMKLIAKLGQAAKSAFASVQMVLSLQVKGCASQQALIAVGTLAPKSAEAKKALFVALSHPDFMVRMRAANLLSKWNAKNTKGPFLKLLQDPNESVRRAAIDGLKALKAKEAIQPFIRLLREDKSLHVLIGVIRACGVFGKDAKPALPALKALARKPSFFGWRAYTMKVIKKIEQAR